MTASTIVIVAALSIDFIQRSTPSIAPQPNSEIAVIFTGQFNRIEAGLVMLETERASVLFVSGANTGAGIRPEIFVEQFALPRALQSALEDGRIVLASNANTTFENAIETACWIKLQDNRLPIVLITDRFHMPRASVALERAVSGSVELQRVFPEQILPVEEGTFHIQELLKFVATWGITLLPPALWPSNISSECMA